MKDPEIPLRSTGGDAFAAAARARYLQRYGLQDRIFRSGDKVLRALIRPRPSPGLSGLHPRRILLVNAGHLGDVILTTGLIPVLRDAFAGAEIGFLTGSYSRLVVDSHPLIDRVHYIDHWHASRQSGPRWRKILTYVAAVPKLLRELRSVGYDVAIDVRCLFPNLVGLLWLSRIPVRIGYDRLGGGPLLTNPVAFTHRVQHEFDYHLALLAGLSIPKKSLATAWPTIAAPSSDAEAEAVAIVPNSPRYCVLHPLGSTPTRDWKPENWRELARALSSAGITPVVTGTGPRAKALAGAIVKSVPGAIDAVDALSWAGLVAVIARADVVFSVETVVGHVASALRRPVVSICGGMTEPFRWAPLGAAVATNRVPCHPCLVKAGCVTRECIQDLSVQDVLSAWQTLAGAAVEDTAHSLQTA